MAAPNTDMIAASLTSCSIDGSGGGGQSQPRAAEASRQSAGSITVDLSSEAALPFHWEQRLDIKTGEIYYINRETGVRATDDPRTAAAAAHSYAYPSSFDDDDDGSDSTLTDCSSHSSASSPPKASSSASQTLVAAGCKACFTFFMVPKSIPACPKCSGCLLHLGCSGACL